MSRTKTIEAKPMMKQKQKRKLTPQQKAAKAN